MATEGEMYGLLRVRYPVAEYALFRHVANGTGAGTNRTLDAMAMNLYPSRGLDILGFEIKCSRSDWLTELKNPEKAEALARYCDNFYLVISEEKFVKDGELPEGWGLLVADSGKLVMKKRAPKLSPVDVSRSQLAAILRSAQRRDPDAEAIAGANRRGFTEGYQRGRLEVAAEEGRDLEAAKKQYKSLEDRVKAFDEASGISINHWGGNHVGAQLKLFMESQGWAAVTEDRLRQLAVAAAQIHESVQNKLALLEPELLYPREPEATPAAQPAILRRR